MKQLEFDFDGNTGEPTYIGFKLADIRGWYRLENNKMSDDVSVINWFDNKLDEITDALLSNDNGAVIHIPNTMVEDFQKFCPNIDITYGD